MSTKVNGETCENLGQSAKNERRSSWAGRKGGAAVSDSSRRAEKKTQRRTGLRRRRGKREEGETITIESRDNGRSWGAEGAGSSRHSACHG